MFPQLWINEIKDKEGKFFEDTNFWKFSLLILNPLLKKIKYFLLEFILSLPASLQRPPSPPLREWSASLLGYFFLEQGYPRLADE